MNSDRKLMKWHEKIRQVKIWQLVALFILFFFISSTFLRLNDVGMSERRNAVISADKVGDDEVIQQRLYALQRYTSSHMNADTGDIYLTNKYDRDVEKIVKETEQSNAPNRNIFKEADDICKQRFYGYSQSYVQCIDSELAKYPARDNPITEMSFPDPALYKYSFASPAWSFDFAGLSTLLTAIFAVLIIVRTITELVLRVILKKQYRRI